MTLKPEEKSWAMWCHLTSLAGLLGIPLGNIVGPLVTWQMKKDESAFVNEHGKESVNFQISLMLYTLGAFIALFLGFFFFLSAGIASVAANTRGTPTALLPFILGGGFIGPLIGVMIFPLLGLIFSILAAVRASNGESYRYPFTIRFIR